MSPRTRVLLVEDNEADAWLVVDELESYSREAGSNYAIEHVPTLQKASSRLADEPLPDVVLLDLGLPDGGEGLNPLLTVMDVAPGLPVVVLSGRQDPSTMRGAIQAGAHDYLIKDMGVSGKRLHHVIGLARLRSEREERERQDRHELDSFAHTVAHDLRNPLSVISGMSAALVGNSLDPTSVTDMAQRIHDSALYLQEIVAGLLAFSSAGDARQLDAVDMNNVVDWVSGLIDDELTACGGVLLTVDMPVVYSDEVALRSILLNLITNSIKYRHRDRPLEVSLSWTMIENGSVEISVSDNGIGIPEEQREAVFARGARLHATSEKGLGIGLSTVQRLVASIGGSVWITDAGDDGTAVRFVLQTSVASS